MFGVICQRAVRFRRGPVRQIGMILILVLQMLQGLLGLLEDVVPPGQQFQAEIFPLALIHEGFVFCGRIVLGKENFGLHTSSLCD